MFGRRAAGISLLSARTGRRAPAIEPAKPPAGDEALLRLEALSAALQEVLAPVKPPAGFRQALARDLVALARQKRSPHIILQRPADHRREILIGAAVSSAVSVAGLVALLWHHRARHAAQHAS